MAYKVLNKTATFGASANDWDDVSNTTTMSTANRQTNTTGLTSATFTAPTAVNNSTGCVLYFSTINGSCTYTVTLLESGVVKATGTITATSALNATYYYVRWASPYTYTTTAAGTYAIKVTASNNSVNFLASDSGTSFFYMATDDRHLALATTDDLIICGVDGAATTLTFSGTAASNAFGDAVAALAASNTQFQQLGYAAVVGYNGTMSTDATTPTTLTYKGGIIVCNGGALKIASAGTPAAAQQYIIANTAGANGVYGFAFANGSMCQVYGRARTFFYTKLASGVGTAASPLVTQDAVDWNVGDEIVIGSTDTAAHNERRYIITKNSSTSYVVSSTSGGAETALAFTHAVGAYICVLSNTVEFTHANTASGYQFSFHSGSATAFTDGVFRYVTFRYTGGTFQFTHPTSATPGADVSYCTSVDYRAAFTINNSSTTATYTGLVSYNDLQTANVSFGSSNKTFIDCFFFSSQRTALTTAGVNNQFTRLRLIGNNTTNVGNTWIMQVQSNFCTYTSCEFQANNQYTAIGGIGNTFKACLFGTVGVNAGGDLWTVTSQLATALFDACTFGSVTLISNIANALNGTELAFQRYQNTDNSHRWYTPSAINYSTGAGLADTNVRTAGSLGLRLSPINTTTGAIWSFQVLAKANTAVSAFGFVQLNAALTGDSAASCSVTLTLPGSLTPDYTYTVPKTTNSWQPWNVLANYTGAYDGLATITVTATTATANAYAYIDDLYNGTNHFISLEVWDKGKPSPIMFEQLGDASAVWAVATSTLTTAGTTGLKLVQGSTKGDIAALD